MGAGDEHHDIGDAIAVDVGQRQLRGPVCPVSHRGCASRAEPAGSVVEEEGNLVPPIRHHDIRQTVAIHIAHGNLRRRAEIGVADLRRRELAGSVVPQNADAHRRIVVRNHNIQEALAVEVRGNGLDRCVGDGNHGLPRELERVSPSRSHGILYAQVLQKRWVGSDGRGQNFIPGGVQRHQAGRARVGEIGHEEGADAGGEVAQLPGEEWHVGNRAGVVWALGNGGSGGRVGEGHRAGGNLRSVARHQAQDLRGVGFTVAVRIGEMEGCRQGIGVRENDGRGVGRGQPRADAGRGCGGRAEIAGGEAMGSRPEGVIQNGPPVGARRQALSGVVVLNVAHPEHISDRTGTVVCAIGEGHRAAQHRIARQVRHGGRQHFRHGPK